MGFFDDIGSVFSGGGLLSSLMGSVATGPSGALLGAIGGKKIGKFMNPKPDDPTAPATSSSASDPANQSAMQKAEEEEQLKARGEAANFLTSGGGAGLSSMGTTSRATLMGS